MSGDLHQQTVQTNSLIESEFSEGVSTATKNHFWCGWAVEVYSSSWFPWGGGQPSGNSSAHWGPEGGAWRGLRSPDTNRNADQRSEWTSKITYVHDKQSIDICTSRSTSLQGLILNVVISWEEQAFGTSMTSVGWGNFQELNIRQHVL